MYVLLCLSIKIGSDALRLSEGIAARESAKEEEGGGKPGAVPTTARMFAISHWRRFNRFGADTNVFLLFSLEHDIVRVAFFSVHLYSALFLFAFYSLFTLRQSTVIALLSHAFNRRVIKFRGLRRIS